MDKLKLTGQNLGRVFNSKRGHACQHQAITLVTKTVQLEAKKLAKMTFRCSPITFRALR